MNTTKNVIRIESLDAGFIVSQNGKSKAIEHSDTVNKILEAIIVEMVKPTRAGQKVVVVSLEVEVNPPQIAG